MIEISKNTFPFFQLNITNLFVTNFLRNTEILFRVNLKKWLKWILRIPIPESPFEFLTIEG